MLLVLVIATGDFVTGPYLAFASFYLLPVAIAAWFAGRRVGVAVGALGAVVGVLCTAADPGQVSQGAYLWNGGIRFVTSSVFAVLLAAEHGAVTTIRELALTDPLTGLLNRREFYALAERDTTRARREGTPLTMVYLDVDELKERNDTLGHEAGDQMLVRFADAARSTLRTSDLVARLGGDEFALLLPNTDTEAAVSGIERLRVALAGDEGPSVAFSAGVVEGPFPQGTDIEAMVRAADLAMIDAKLSGKGRTVVHGADPTVATASA